MAVHSAGLLLHRRRDGAREVLIAHMGGPFWARKDAAAWSIPKGILEEGEDAADAAVREFAEEMGSPAPPGPLVALGEFRQRGGKVVTVFAREGDFDAAAARSNTFEMEWPRGSGRVGVFPEMDRAEWSTIDVARTRLVAGQVPALDALLDHLGGDADAGG